MKSIENPRKSKEALFNSDPNSPIVEQLTAFQPDKSTHFTALKFLTDPEDIRRYFKEAVELVKQDEPENRKPEDVVIGSLDYISRYGGDYEKGWKRFKKVIGNESGYR